MWKGLWLDTTAQLNFRLARRAILATAQAPMENPFYSREIREYG
jgi:hypothetical protein